jgi:serine/threonine protein kinase
MWNRALEALHLLHTQGYVHANVTPDRFLIVPETHQGTLIDFCYARKAGQPAKAVSSAWKSIYPPELLEKKSLDFSTDLYMVSHCMNYLLGGEVGSNVVPAGTPVALAGLLRACWLGRAHRTNSAKDLHADFRTVRHGLGWSREFRHFVMSKTTK